MKHDHRVALVLFVLRISVFLAMFVWILDRLVRPTDALSIYEPLHLLKGVSHEVLYGIAVIELIILVSFLMGIQKRWSYGAVLVLNAAWIVSSYHQFFAPFVGKNLLFFAAWPMFAACFGLYVLRHLDTLWVIDKY